MGEYSAGGENMEKSQVKWLYISVGFSLLVLIIILYLTHQRKYCQVPEGDQPLLPSSGIPDPRTHDVFLGNARQEDVRFARLPDWLHL